MTIVLIIVCIAEAGIIAGLLAIIEYQELNGR